MPALLDVNAITCRYGTKTIFSDLSFQVEPGSIACLLGPSGCGKTTALRAIAGFEPVYGGAIMLDGQRLSAPGLTLPPEQRQVGMVFQDYALFPHLNVAANIAFGLQRHSRAERARITANMLALIRLEACAESYPHQLSGGQQQRIALARALAPQPKLLLLDEPFSNLDTELRRTLSLEVRDILRQAGTTAILVTHDQTEAFNVADEIGVMAEGELLQWGSARDLYQTPQSAFVASFVSGGILIPGKLGPDGAISTCLGTVHLPIDELPATPPGTALDLLLRPWNLIQATDDGPPNARITSQQFQGAFTLTALELDDGSQLSSLDADLAALAIGSNVRLGILPHHLRAFARQNDHKPA